MISSFIYWQFVESPKKLLFILKKTNLYIYNLFSIGFLLKSLFAPWKRDLTNIPNPSLGDQLKMLTDNLISRFVGFVVRFFTILTGLIIQVITLVVGIAVFIVWVFLPLVIVYLIYISII